MDPFELVDSFLHELVLQHFKAKEAVEVVSLVSPVWSQIVGNSKTCMNKVRFLYQVWRHQFFSSSEVLKQSQKTFRCYQHVIVELGVNDDSRQFWKFMETCCGSLRTLKIENIRSNIDSTCLVEFPNLERFTVFGIDDNVLKQVLNSTKKLKSLFAVSGSSSIEPSVIQSLINCLERNRKLEDLYLKNANFTKIFEEDFEVQFSLKSFKLMNTTADNSITTKVEENLLKFLKQQKKTLETFFFDFSSDKIIELAFNGLPALTSAGLLNSQPGKFKQNPRIKNLEIPYIDDMPSILKFVDATPNLENLFVEEVSKELVDHLAWNNASLRSLNFKMIDTEAEEHYEQLKSDHPEVNQNIEIWDYENIDWD